MLKQLCRSLALALALGAGLPALQSSTVNADVIAPSKDCRSNNYIDCQTCWCIPDQMWGGAGCAWGKNKAGCVVCKTLYGPCESPGIVGLPSW